jgi:hypothetical protein
MSLEKSVAERLKGSCLQEEAAQTEAYDAQVLANEATERATAASAKAVLLGAHAQKMKATNSQNNAAATARDFENIDEWIVGRRQAHADMGLMKDPPDVHDGDWEQNGPAQENHRQMLASKSVKRNAARIGVVGSNPNMEDMELRVVSAETYGASGETCVFEHELMGDFTDDTMKERRRIEKPNPGAKGALAAANMRAPMDGSLNEKVIGSSSGSMLGIEEPNGRV